MNKCINTLQSTFHVLFVYYLHVGTFIILPAFYFKSFQNLKMPKYTATHHEITRKTKYICIKKRLLKIIVRVRICSNKQITSNNKLLTFFLTVQIKMNDFE